MIQKNSLIFSSFIAYRYQFSYFCNLSHLLPFPKIHKSTSLFLTHFFIHPHHPRDRYDFSLGDSLEEPSHVCLLPRIYVSRAMCKSCTLCASCRRIYVSFVAMHIYSQSQTPRSCSRRLSIFGVERAFRKINISSTAPASSSSTRLNHPALLFPSPDSAVPSYVSGNRKTKTKTTKTTASSNRTRRISRGNGTRDGRMDESRKNRASFGKPCD